MLVGLKWMYQDQRKTKQVSTMILLMLVSVGCKIKQVYLMIMLAEGKTNMVIFMFFSMLVRLSSVEVETKKLKTCHVGPCDPQANH